MSVCVYTSACALPLFLEFWRGEKHTNWGVSNGLLAVENRFIFIKIHTVSWPSVKDAVFIQTLMSETQLLRYYVLLLVWIPAAPKPLGSLLSESQSCRHSLAVLGCLGLQWIFWWLQPCSIVGFLGLLCFGLVLWNWVWIVEGKYRNCILKFQCHRKEASRPLTYHSNFGRWQIL